MNTIYADIEFLKPNQYGWARFDTHKYGYREIYAREDKDWHVILDTHLETKESYLEWVKEWKSAYKELSAKIRKAKANRKLERAEGRDQAHWQSEAYIGRKYARRMLEMRKVAKKFSYTNKLAAQEREREAVVA